MRATSSRSQNRLGEVTMPPAAVKKGEEKLWRYAKRIALAMLGRRDVDWKKPKEANPVLTKNDAWGFVMDRFMALRNGRIKARHKLEVNRETTMEVKEATIKTKAGSEVTLMAGQFALRPGPMGGHMPVKVISVTNGTAIVAHFVDGRVEQMEIAADQLMGYPNQDSARSEIQALWPYQYKYLLAASDVPNINEVAQPKDVVAVYDSGEEDMTGDRYTVILGGDWEDAVNDTPMIGIGGSQRYGARISYGLQSGRVGSHLGRKVKWSDLSSDQQKVVVKFLKESTEKAYALHEQSDLEGNADESPLGDEESTLFSDLLGQEDPDAGKNMQTYPLGGSPNIRAESAAVLNVFVHADGEGYQKPLNDEPFTDLRKAEMFAVEQQGELAEDLAILDGKNLVKIIRVSEVEEEYFGDLLTEADRLIEAQITEQDDEDPPMRKRKRDGSCVKESDASDDIVDAVMNDEGVYRAFQRAVGRATSWKDMMDVAEMGARVAKGWNSSFKYNRGDLQDAAEELVTMEESVSEAGTRGAGDVSPVDFLVSNVRASSSYEKPYRELQSSGASWKEYIPLVRKMIADGKKYKSFPRQLMKQGAFDDPKVIDKTAKALAGGAAEAVESDPWVKITVEADELIFEDRHGVLYLPGKVETIDDLRDIYQTMSESLDESDASLTDLYQFFEGYEGPISGMWQRVYEMLHEVEDIEEEETL